MNRFIIGFHEDDEHHWVAELDCGHNQHVRHDPSWSVAPGSLLPREGKRLWEEYFIAKNAMQVRPRIDDVHGNHSWPDLAFNRARIANVAHVCN